MSKLYIMLTSSSGSLEIEGWLSNKVYDHYAYIKPEVTAADWN